MTSGHEWAVQYVNPLSGFWALYDYAAEFWDAVVLYSEAQRKYSAVRMIRL